MLSPDRPIASQEEDLLGREALARQLASWIREAPRDEGFVIGVTGPWGSGKTSVLNLLEEQLDSSTTVVRFEPWLFSSADELVTRFFGEVAAQLLTEKSRWARRIGKRVTEYGAVVGPAASIALGPAGQLLAMLPRLSSLNKPSAVHKREELRTELTKQSRRLVVLIDDIDRLDAREVREVMRLVKLVADLPNVVHVLSYDQARVQDALDTEGQDGRAYLEKIVQATMAVPPIHKDRLRTICFGWMNEAIGERELEAWDPAAWERLVDGGIEDYLHTLRDGRRLANMMPAILDLIGDEVASMDVIALEAVRIFDPEIHEKLPNIADALTGERNLSNFLIARDKWNERAKERIDAVFTHSGHSEVTRAVLARLFPAASHLLGGNLEASGDGSLEVKRVASPAVFRRYLHRSLSTGEAPSTRVDAVVDALGDAELLSSLLIDCPDEELADLLQRARKRASEQAQPEVVGSSLVLLRAIPRMRSGLGFLDIEPDRHILHFVEDLLETLHDAERPEAACRIIKDAPSLSLRAQLLYRLRIPPEEPSNEPRLDILEASKFEHLRSQLSDDIRQASAGALAEEAMPFWLVQIVSDVHGTAAALDVVRPPEVLRAVLERLGTALHPISSGRFSLHLKPLVDAAGEPVLGLLTDLAKGETLSSDLADELRTALEHPPGNP